MAALVSSSPSPFSSIDGWGWARSVAGYTRICRVKVPGSSWARTALRVPPAESPPTAIREGSPPRAPISVETHLATVMTSSTAAGKGCSGASR
jgi:hypothetical protein